MRGLTRLTGLSSGAKTGIARLIVVSMPQGQNRRSKTRTRRSRTSDGLFP